MTVQFNHEHGESTMKRSALTLSDLVLGIGDLLTVRRELLLLLLVGPIFARQLQKALDAINALPAIYRGGVPLAEELKAADDLHDDFGSAISLLMEALLRCPAVSSQVKALAKRILETFVPNLNELNSSYPDEAAAARSRRPMVQAMNAELQSIQVAGMPVLDWVEGQLNAADKLDELLSTRAGQQPGSRREAGMLRSTTLGLLDSLRNAVKVELADNASLPRDLETQLFGYLDQLAETRSRAAKNDKSSDTPASK